MILHDIDGFVSYQKEYQKKIPRKRDFSGKGKAETQ